MTNSANALRHRDEFGFLRPRVAKPQKPTSVFWLAVGLAVTWVSACSLALAVSLSSIS